MRFKQFLQAMLFGALGFLVLFIVETALLMSNETSASLSINVEGPFKMLLAVTYREVLWLLVRIAIAYMLTGACLFTLWLFHWSILMTQWPNIKRHYRLILASLDLFLCVSLVVLGCMAARPALFDDLTRLRPLIAWSMQHVNPNSIKLFFAAFFVIHLIALCLSHTLKAHKKLHRTALVFTLLIVYGSTHHSWYVYFYTHIYAQQDNQNTPLIFIYGIDALRFDNIEHLKYVDNFLHKNITFTQAYTPIASTAPAWQSLLTSQLPAEHGLRYPLIAKHLIKNRTEQPTTFVEQFSHAGFDTLFFTDCSRFHTQSSDNGFRSIYAPPAGALNFVLEKLRFRVLGLWSALPFAHAFLPEMIHNRALAGLYHPSDYIDYVTRTIIQHRYTGKHTQAQPLLVAIHTTETHFPGDPVSPYYQPLLALHHNTTLAARMPFKTSEQISTNQQADKQALAIKKAHYQALIRAADDQFGRFQDNLHTLHWFNQSTLVLLSDHGEDFLEDFPPFWATTSVHGARLNEAENHIVLGFKWPSDKQATAPLQVDALVRLYDVGPTLLEFFHLPIPLAVAGQSLWPLLNNTTPHKIPMRLLHAETSYTQIGPHVFNLDRFQQVPRDISAFKIWPDGTVSVDPQFHEALLYEKEYGLFDGQRWLSCTYQPKVGWQLHCQGNCASHRNQPSCDTIMAQ